MYNIGDNVWFKNGTNALFGQIIGFSENFYKIVLKDARPWKKGALFYVNEEDVVKKM